MQWVNEVAIVPNQLKRQHSLFKQLPYDQTMLLLGISQQGIKIYVHTKTCLQLSIRALSRMP